MHIHNTMVAHNLNLFKEMTYFLFSLIKLIVYCCLDLQSNYNTIIVHGLQLSGDSRWLTEKTKDIFDRQIFAHF